jgi:tetratricopeptide (TPR) repeat protein
MSASVLAGCQQNTKPVQPPPVSYDQLMEQAEARIRAQDVDGAKTYFSKAAAADPTRKEPWYRLAQLDFNQQNYGKSIVDAQEVLQRDASDMNAESILTVAGLRVAVDALGRLHDEADLQGPAHQEAVKLAQKMRDTLGQDVLVPPAAKKTRRPARRAAAKTDGSAASQAQPQSAPAGSQSTPSANDPFSVLRNGGN